MKEEIKVNGLRTPEDFISSIEEMVKKGGADYLDAVLEYCNRTGLEVEVAASLVKRSGLLMEKVEEEAEKMHIIPKTAKLPI